MVNENTFPDMISYENFASSESNVCALLSWEGSDYGVVELGGICDNSCVFCHEVWDSDGYNEGFDLVENMEDILQRTKKVVFCKMEPTQDPRLVETISQARKKEDIQVILTTNARKLRDEDYCRQLIDAGVDVFSISLHGKDAKTHDALTRRQGSFKQSILGLKNLLRLRGQNDSRGLRADFKVRINCVLTKSNLKDLKDSLLFFSGLSRHSMIDRINFATIIPRGRGRDNYGSLMPSYKDILEAFNEVAVLFREIQHTQKLPKTTLSGIPFCSYNLYRKVLGLEKLPMMISGKDEFFEMKSKPSFCSRCIFDSSCCGIWDDYMRIYDVSSFLPFET
jgi:MoaA/NifB/PqqE/SkfB family radical SAM enzyme